MRQLTAEEIIACYGPHAKQIRAAELNCNHSVVKGVPIDWFDAPPEKRGPPIAWDIVSILRGNGMVRVNYENNLSDEFADRCLVLIYEV